jgi:hypothetical protein
MTLAPMVEEQVRLRMAPGDAALVLDELGRTELPLVSSPSRECSRIVLAILILSKGDLAQFDAWLQAARVDWRDVLVAAGLGNVDWPRVLSGMGYPVP